MKMFPATRATCKWNFNMASVGILVRVTVRHWTFERKSNACKMRLDVMKERILEIFLTTIKNRGVLYSLSFPFLQFHSDSLRNQCVSVRCYLYTNAGIILTGSFCLMGLTRVVSSSCFPRGRQRMKDGIKATILRRNRIVSVAYTKGEN